jgi:molybdopterin-containing oxidoreductase family iron-sulfur binding subunit
MSLEQWRQDPEFLALAEKEFQSSPLQSEDGKSGTARRDFLKLMGASIALTSFGCVRRPVQKIIPYAKKPADIIHGTPNYYASSYVDGMEAIGVLVTTRDGRPIKIDGNPDHPANMGRMSARAHADILRLYDPDRYTAPKRNLQNKNRTNREIINAKWEDLDKAVIEQLGKGKVAVLTYNHASPTTQALMEEFAGAFGGRIYQYDDVSYASLMEAQKVSYGTAAVPRLHLDRAKMIVAINNDFLGTWVAPITYNRQFSMGRKNPAEGISKLVVFESLMSLTGSNADKRFRIRPSQSLDVVMALLHELVVVRKASRYAGDDGVVRVLSGFSKTREDLGFSVGDIADELWKNRGQSLVLAGGMSADGDFGVQLQVAANFLNAVLENDGKTIETGKAVVRGGTMGELIDALNKKEIKTLIIHGSNPVYSLPASAKFADALKNVEMLISTADRNDETARLADYVATDHHALENWGDMQSLDGSLSIQQPTIRPLHDTRAFQDSMLAWLKGANKGSAKAKAANTWYDYLNASWKTYAAGKYKGSFEDYWNDVLQTGVMQGAPASGGGRSLSAATLSGVKPAAKRAGFELAVYQKVGIGDGRLANVPWLQELPDPITKVCWDNYACLSPKDSVQLKVKQGEHVTLTVGDAKIDLPVHIQPGQADGVVGVAFGYGRDGGGKVVDGIGQNAMAIAQWANGRAITAGLETSVQPSGKRTILAITQGHHVMEGRQIVVEETAADHAANPGGQIHKHELTTMWSGHNYPGNKWGMTIDLNTCTGCSACVIACQSENNIPTVGKKNVIDGREMQWLRIDRYYVGTPEDPDVVHQPLPCMHCDNAPCETVCPVIATVHSDEGTNDMIYNRCVGTRYCSNNCPYKVRRFNWFSYTDIQAPREMALNPDVTVRFRGVMEKCTFCLHRIRAVKSQAKIEDRKLKDGDVKTACQQACPTSAIIFGDLNDPNSAVRQQFNLPKSYPLLAELNTRPSVRYQVKVRNTDKLKYVPTHAAGHTGGPGKHGEHKDSETETKTPGHTAPKPAETTHPTEVPAHEGGHQ